MFPNLFQSNSGVALRCCNYYRSTCSITLKIVVKYLLQILIGLFEIIIEIARKITYSYCYFFFIKNYHRHPSILRLVVKTTGCRFDFYKRKFTLHWCRGKARRSVSQRNISAIRRKQSTIQHYNI